MSAKHRCVVSEDYNRLFSRMDYRVTCPKCGLIDKTMTEHGAVIIAVRHEEGLHR